MTNWYADDALWAGPEANRHAGNKAREDVTTILKDMGFEQLPVFTEEVHSASASALHKLSTHRHVANVWDESFSKAQKGDVIVVQFPPVNHSLNFGSVIAKHEARGVHVVLLVHDLEAVRAVIDEGLSRASRFRIMREEIKPLRSCSAVIAHNRAMANVLADEFDVDRARIVELGLFDYLAPGRADNARFALNKPVIVCGALRNGKAGYAYCLPESPCFNLYGPGFDGEEQSNVAYHGSFPPEQLQDVVEGSFGLVWDGPSSSTCLGPYGNYLRVNNPHKTSLYLSMGMPVIVWSESALASFVKQHGVGIAVESLDDLDPVLCELDEEAYEAMCDAVLLIASKLRSGEYTRHAIDSAMELPLR